MQDRLKKIYRFLKANRKYNYQVQKAFYHECVCPYKTPSDKAKSLLFHILNTQSRPKIDKVAMFWQSVLSDRNKLSSFTAFTKAIGIKKNDKGSFANLFFALKKQPGWGVKTAALFVKAIYHLHNGKYKKYAFWKDIPELLDGDILYLPVDTVINHLFEKISSKKTRSFSSINHTLQTIYKGKEMEIWDDLWFWGFITQRTRNGKRRIIEFNNAKYWALQHTNKEIKNISEIKNKAKEFNILINTK